MNKKVLLIGNGINNLTNSGSWLNLLRSMTERCNVSQEVEINTDKPFPLLYEEIYLKSRGITEFQLKEHISTQVKKIKENEVHELIRTKRFENIITTNYEYILQGANLTLEKDNLSNQGVIKETKYSIFRYNIIDNTKIWHIHGECNTPNSIILGYEHYGGQLQQIRNYVVSGTNYKKKKNQTPLSSKLKNDKVLFESWIDLFFKKNIHIIGLAMDFVETDIWWLLTYRARLMKTRKTTVINEILYYIPKKYVKSSKNKISLLESVNVSIIIKNEENNFEYYKNIIKNII